MRQSFALLGLALPAMAGGLVLGWAAIAAAATPQAAGAAPPAAPIFYCPSASAAKPQACLAPPAHVATAPPRHLRYHREVRVAEHGARPHEAVSASQAFIYRYEQAQHGLDARAADEAWAHAGPPHRQWAEAPPPQVIVERAPPPPQVIIERAPPPPPKIIIEHAPAPPPQIVFERAPAPPPQVIYERAPPCPERCPPPAPRAHGWQDRAASRGYMVERQTRERSGGWRYSEQNGQGRYQAWGDARRRRPCPPPVAAAGCAGAATYASGEAEWRDGSYGSYGQVYRYSGRDAVGYLVWPGKTAP